MTKRVLSTGFLVCYLIPSYGQLFQNRYKSIICQIEAYYTELVRYIHLNSLRAGLVEDLKGLADYAFSGRHLLADAVDSKKGQ